MILSKFNEGDYSPSQLTNLRHLEEFAQWWFWFDNIKEPTNPNANKLPKNPRGGYCSTSDPATAGTLEQALAAMTRERGGGVSLLVSAGVDGLVGIDVDNVIHEGDMHPLGREVLEQFKGAYVEVSPSGAGLRVFCLGTLPDGLPSNAAMGQEHHGVQIKFEVYAAGGGGRHLRCTGRAVTSPAGAVIPCQSGIDWYAGKMMAAKAVHGGGAAKPAPDKTLSLDDMSAELAELRPELGAGDVESAIVAAVGAAGRSKLAEAWRGNLNPWHGDPSRADFFLACEIIRRGAGHVEDVVAVWAESGLGQRDKFKQRVGYVADTAGKAAQSVLSDLRDKASKGGTAGGAAVALPDDLLAALEASGDKVTRGKSGKLEPTAGNVTMLFRNDARLVGLLAFNELAQRGERLTGWTVFDRGAAQCAGALSDDDVVRVSMWLSTNYGMRMDHKELMRGVDAAALDARFDPLATRLRALGQEWDGVERVDRWLVEHALVDDKGCTEFVRAAGRCFLVGAVARALSPGCQLDTVLSVEGSGGAGKSSMFKVLADAVAPNLFADGVQDVSNPVALIEGTAGRWIVELAELAGIRRAADVEALKASITRREDSHRRPYDVLPRTLPRRFIFVATTNRTEGYLADPSGALARRFHPVRTLATETRPIDRAALAAVAGQLWAEAVRMYLDGVAWHIAEADGEAFRQWTAGRELRREDGAFQDEMFGYLQNWAGENPAEGRSLRDIALGVGDTKTAESGGTGGPAMALAGTLTMLGMEKRKSGISKWYFSPQAATRFAGLRAQAVKATAASK